MRGATYDRAMDVSLRDLSRSNVRAICELRLAESQQDLVAEAAFTVAEGGYEPGAVLKAVYVGEVPVGVVLVETEGLAPHLARFMIDASWQQRGIGRRAVDLLAAELADAGCQTLETCFVPVPHGAEGFWRRCGFADTGRRNYEGEPIWSLPLSA